MFYATKAMVASTTESKDFSKTTNIKYTKFLTKYGERAFSYSSMSEWDALSENLRAVEDPANFRRQLKTHYCGLAVC